MGNFDDRVTMWVLLVIDGMLLVGTTVTLIVLGVKGEIPFTPVCFFGCPGALSVGNAILYILLALKFLFFLGAMLALVIRQISRGFMIFLVVVGVIILIIFFIVTLCLLIDAVGCTWIGTAADWCVGASTFVTFLIPGLFFAIILVNGSILIVYPNVLPDTRRSVSQPIGNPSYRVLPPQDDLRDKLIQVENHGKSDNVSLTSKSGFRIGVQRKSDKFA